MEKQIKVRIEGIEVLAHQWSSGTIFVRGKEIAKIVRAIVKQYGYKKASVVTNSYSGGCSIRVKLPYFYDQIDCTKLKERLRSLEGSKFDAMTDYKDSVERKTDDGQRAYFGADWISVEKDWRTPTPPPFNHPSPYAGGVK